MSVSSALEQRLATVGLDPASAKVLAVLPLVHVAWADGAVQAAERALIDEQIGLLGPTPDGTLVLNNWLAFRPSAELVRRGHEALGALLAESGPGRPTPRSILAYCRRIAAAAGGVLGLGAITRAEQRAIAQIARALQVGTDRPWNGGDESAGAPPADAPPKASPRVTVTFHTKELPGITSVAALVGEHGDRCPVDADGVVVGRAPGCDVQVGCDGLVSRRHCRLEERARKYYVTDLGSAKGTYVDGDRVLARRLFGGEVLRVGASTFRFVHTRFVGAPAEG